MFRDIEKSKSKDDLLSSFLAITCAVTIGLNISWSPEETRPDEQQYSNAQQDNIKAILYLVAIQWSQWSGTVVRSIGAYKLMVIGVCVSICAGILMVIFPCDVVYFLYVARALQGFGCASLAVAVPIYTVENSGELYQGAMLCLIEVFILIGVLISHALSALVISWNRKNILTTLVISLNVFSLILIRVMSQNDTSQTNCDLFMDNKANRYLKKPRGIQGDAIVPTWDESLVDVYKRLFTKKENRNVISIRIALFVFRDFSGIHMLKRSIQRIFSELNTTPVSYRQCALLLTIYQLIFAIVTVFMVEFYGQRKLMFISSFGMLLSMMILELIIWNNNFITAEADRNIYFLIVLLIYILSFAHGLGSIPWAIQFETFHQNMRYYATGLIISSHFLFLMISEFSYINEKSIYSTGSFWFIFVCCLQIIFVNVFISEEKDFY